MTRLFSASYLWNSVQVSLFLSFTGHGVSGSTSGVVIVIAGITYGTLGIRGASIEESAGIFQDCDQGSKSNALGLIVS